MKQVVLGVTLAVLVGCGVSPTSPPAPAASTQGPDARPALAFFSNVRPTLASFAGTYSLTIDVDASCPLVPASGKVRRYDVSLTDSPYGYLAVGTPDSTLVGDLWASGLFRWNGDEMDLNCGSSETVDAAAYCLWGQGSASAGGDGVISGVLAGGVNIGADRCRGSHRFVLRRKP